MSVSGALVAVVATSACGEDTVTPPPTTTTGGGTAGEGGATTTQGGGATTATGGGGGMGGVGGTMTGGGGTGGMMVIPGTGDDTCPGDEYALTPGTHLLLGGDTSSATDDYAHPNCGPDGMNGPDRAYRFTFSQYGSLLLQVRPAEGSQLNPSLMWQADGACENMVDPPLACLAFFESQEGLAVEVGPGAPEPFDVNAMHVVVDGENGTSGEYVLDVRFEASSCGDATFNSLDGEECDDGNTMANDGCGPACQTEDTTLFDSCPGEPVFVFPNQPTVVQSGNWGYSDTYQHTPTTGCSIGQLSNNPDPDITGGKDRIYSVTPTESGTLTVKIGYGMDGVTDICETEGFLSPNCWNRLIYATGPDLCDEAPQDGVLDSPQLACADATSAGAFFNPEEISFQVEGTKQYYVFVDAIAGFPTYVGSFNLHFELTP